jgi:hypothetical protein
MVRLSTDTIAVETVNIESFKNALMDRLLLLSPRTWLGILEIQDKNDASPFSLAVLSESVAGLLVPLLMLRLLHAIMISWKLTIADSNLAVQWSRFFWMTLLSPWIMQCWHEICCQLAAIWSAVHNYKMARAQALHCATDVFRQRIAQGRAYRKRRYDVFLPPVESFSQTSNTQQALLLLPGALIPHVAYAETASRLSDMGILVAVVSMEPFRLAYHHTGADQKSIKSIMQQIQRKQQQKLQWTIMGHSMGSFAAMHLFDKLLQQGHCRPSGDIVIRNRIVLWGVAAFVPFVTDLSHHFTTEVLLVQGTKDTLREMLKHGNQVLEASFPPRTVTEYIKGGTHDGFGSYTSPTVIAGSFDQKRIKQQEQACKVTAEFLLDQKLTLKRR